MKKNINIFEKYFVRLFNSKSYFKHRIRRLIDKKKIGSFEFRYSIGCLERMHYAYIVFNAANLAKKLKYNSVSVIEYGVAGGRGLLLLEYYAKEIKIIFDIDIQIYGFDMGSGVPDPDGYKDLTYHWKKGFFQMDIDGIKEKVRVRERERKRFLCHQSKHKKSRRTHHVNGEVLPSLKRKRVDCTIHTSNNHTVRQCNQCNRSTF